MIQSDFSKILDPEDPPSFEWLNRDGKSNLLIVCDHGGREIPKKLNGLGLSDSKRSAHISWDIGARKIAVLLSKAFDAPMISGCYSRLVYDLNRYPWDPTVMAQVSDCVEIPGNANLTWPARQRRYDEIAQPYYSQVFQQILEMKASSRSPTMISVHTMTGQLSGGDFRDEAFAVLSDPNDPISRQFLRALRNATDLPVGDNVPYELESGIDFTVPECAHRMGIPAIMFELRQDFTLDPKILSTRVDEIIKAIDECSLI